MAEVFMSHIGGSLSFQSNRAFYVNQVIIEKPTYIRLNYGDYSLKCRRPRLRKRLAGKPNGSGPLLKITF